VLKLYDSLEVRESKNRIKNRKRVCKDCTVLLALSGSLRSSYIISLSPESNFTCEVCDAKPAVFAIAPYERGLYICDRCVSDRGNKHVWNRFEIKGLHEDQECDLCGKKGVKHIIPAKTSPVPIDLEDKE